MTIAACVFDAYGTLFDVAGAARRAAAEPAGGALAKVWPTLAETWRAKQLAYTWLRAVMGHHADFRTITADALDWAMAAEGLEDPALRDRLLALYDTLPAYPEVPAVLARLRATGLPCAILSNGTTEMLAAATLAAGIAGLIDVTISVEEVGIYKPHPSVYRLAATRLDHPAHDVLFVSANCWDIAGASAFGFRTAWVNRRGDPVDRLPGRPDHILPDLSHLPDLIG